MDLPRTKSLQLVIPTAPTSLRACCCSGQKYYRLRFCFARWCRLLLISSQNFPPCVYGLVQEQTIQSFRHLRRNAWLNFCARQVQTSRFAISQLVTSEHRTMLKAREDG